MKFAFAIVTAVGVFLSCSPNKTESIDSIATPETKAQKPEFHEGKVEEFLSSWHQLAAKGDRKYFDYFSDNGVFMGTDSWERWRKDEFEQKFGVLFNNKKAWEFEARKRNIDFNADSTVIWFDETLDTWMGTCRGSGVIQRRGDDLKIRQYHLAVTVPNAMIADYLVLLKEKGYEDSIKKK